MASSDGLSPSKNPFAYVNPTPKVARTASVRQPRAETPTARSRTRQGKASAHIRDSSPLPPSSPPRPAQSTPKHVRNRHAVADPEHEGDAEAEEDEVANLALDDTLPISSEDGSVAGLSPQREVPWFQEGQDTRTPEYRNSDFSSDLEGLEEGDSLPAIVHPFPDTHQNASALSGRVTSHAEGSAAGRHSPIPTQSSSGPSDPFGFFSAQRQLKKTAIKRPLPKLQPHAADRLTFRRVEAERDTRSELPPAFSTPQNMKVPQRPHKKRVSSEFPVAKSAGPEEQGDGGETSEAGRSTPSPVKRSSGSGNAHKRSSPDDDEEHEDVADTPPPPKRTRTRSTRTTTPAKATTAASRTRKLPTRAATSRKRGLYQSGDDEGSSADEVASVEEEESEEEDPRPRRQRQRKPHLPDFSSPPPAGRTRTRTKRAGTTAKASSRGKGIPSERKVLTDRKKTTSTPLPKGAKGSAASKKKQNNYEDEEYDEVNILLDPYLKRCSLVHDRLTGSGTSSCRTFSSSQETGQLSTAEGKRLCDLS